jgi:hypothetical protein
MHDDEAGEVVILTDQERESCGRMADMIGAAMFYCTPGQDAGEQQEHLKAAALRLFLAGPLPEPVVMDEKMRHALPFIRAAYWYGRAFATDPRDLTPLFERLKQEAYAQARLDDLIRPEERN